MLLKAQELLNRISPRNQNLCLVIGVFLISRSMNIFYFDIRFDLGPLGYYWQYIDPKLLKEHLVQSVYYLHSQPPLFNFFLGVVLKLFPHNYLEAFHFIYMFFGLLFSISLFLIMTEIGIGNKRSLILTCLFMISPITVEYENWLFYEYPTAVLLSWAVFFLHRFVRRKRPLDCFTFFLLISMVVYVRGILSLYWFLLVAVILWAFNWREWKKIVLACSLPLFLILALYVKNFIVFNSFSIGDAQIGSNLALTVTSSLPQDTADALIIQRKITSLYRVPPISPDISNYAPYGLYFKTTGVPILDEKSRSTDSINPHNLIYLEVGKIDLKDAVYVLMRFPVYVLKECGSNLLNGYFLTSDHTQPFYAGDCSGQWNRWDDFFKRVCLGEVNSGRYLFLLLGLPIIFIYGLFFILRSRVNPYKYSSRVEVVAFMMVTIVFLAGSTLFVYCDYSRYRFLVDSFYLVLFGMATKELVQCWKCFFKFNRE